VAIRLKGEEEEEEEEEEDLRRSRGRAKVGDYGDTSLGNTNGKEREVIVTRKGGGTSSLSDEEWGSATSSTTATTTNHSRSNDATKLGISASNSSSFKLPNNPKHSSFIKFVLPLSIRCNNLHFNLAEIDRVPISNDKGLKALAI
jgi:hypothetical protein